MMTAESTRDRRGALFGSTTGQGVSSFDVESLERQNDDSIAALGERVGLLRNITSGIHGEVQSHHAVLDRMVDGMGGISMGLGATVGKFRRVMENPQGRKTVYIALGTALALFVLYLFWR